MRLPPGARAVPAGTGWDAAFALPMDSGLLAFQGHFPGDPILPGVAQVDWAAHFGAQAFGPLGAFQGVDNLKFMAIIRPGEEITLDLALDPARQGLKFVYHGASGRKSMGTLRFAGQGGAG